jgi:replicative DNA helicase
VKKKRILIGEEEENTIMSRIKTYDQAMDEYFEFVGREQSFRLSDRFKHLMPYMRDISPGQVVGMAAASGVGKSQVINQLMPDYAEEADVYGLFASLEMPARDIAIRSSMELTKPHKGNYVDKEKVTERLVSDDSFRKSVVKHHERIAILDNAYELDVILEMMGLYVEYMKKQGKSVTFLTIDFQSLLTGGADVDKQAEIAQKLKMYAKKLDIIIFTLQQFNGLVDKYDEPDSNKISGRRELYMMLDYSFLMWKSRVSKNRIRFKNAKERWNLEGIVDLVQTGMRLHSEEYLDDDEAKIINAGRNRPLEVSKGGLDG